MNEDKNQSPLHNLRWKAEAFDRIVAARKTHIDASAAYNDRLTIVRAERERGNWSMNVDHEYAEMDETARAVDRLVRELCDDVLEGISPAPLQREENK